MRGRGEQGLGATAPHLGVGVDVTVNCNEQLSQLEVATGAGKHERGPPFSGPGRQLGTEGEQEKGNPGVALYRCFMEGC